MLAITDEKVAFANSCEYIQQHISKHIIPKKPGKGWYNAGSNNSELLRLKVIAILNEIMLSMSLTQQGGKLVSFYPKKWMRSLSRFRRFLAKHNIKLLADI